MCLNIIKLSIMEIFYLVKSSKVKNKMNREGQGKETESNRTPKNKKLVNENRLRFFFFFSIILTTSTAIHTVICMFFL